MTTPATGEDEDAPLVARARAGDREAFATLVAKHRDALFRAAFCVLGHEADALDATQEALLRAFRHLEGFDGRASFRTWSKRIATNCALDRLERKKRDRADALPDGDLVAAPPESASDTLDRAHEREVVRRAIDALPPAQKAAVLLRDVEGLSYEAIAERLGIAKGTVMSRIYYGRETLKERLGRLLKDRAAAGRAS